MDPVDQLDAQRPAGQLDLDEGQQRLALALEEFVAAVQSKSTDVTLKLNISMQQLRVVRLLAKQGRMSGRQLAKALGVTPASVVPMCDRLEELGYLERVPDEDDRRITWLELSPKGKQHSHEIARAMRRMISPVLAGIPSEDARRLASVLHALAALVAPEGPVSDAPSAPL